MPKGVYKRRAPQVRFWEKVNRTDGCWLWTAGVFQSGLPYGQFQMDGRPHVAHRVSWVWANGPIPEGQYVLHRCDTPRCVRPDHLFLGSLLDNNRDMIAKKRHPVTGKLSAEQCREIRERIASGPRGTAQRLSEEYGVSNSLIAMIKNGKRRTA